MSRGERPKRDPGNPVTPTNPSRRAVKRVRNPLPVPTVCNCCGGPVALVDNAVIYGRQYGEWPWAYACTAKGCGAYVGLHPFTGIPLGTLAQAPLRDARKAAKKAFNAIWKGGAMTRSQAYAWLAQKMGIADVEQCHIGWFDEQQCAAVEAAVKARIPSPALVGAENPTTGD